MKLGEQFVSRRAMLAGSLMTLWCGCRQAPVTGRRQVLLVPEAKEVSMGLTAYEDVTKKQPLSTNQHVIELVSRVGHRIASVSDRSDFQWEFKVLATNEQNAFCLPGGKVAVYEGILPICENEAGLAVVMSHEIGHALARHGGERMTENYAVQGGQMALSYLSKNQDAKRQQMIQQAYSVGTKYGAILPFSRKQELEADHIGVILMSKAGYDPDEAPKFWSRFSSSHTGKQPTEFMSTHPSDMHRETALTQLMPDARQAYQSASERIGLGEPISPTQVASHTEETLDLKLPTSNKSAVKNESLIQDDWR